jgi:DNA-binding MarR family transcriptional regulator
VDNSLSAQLLVAGHRVARMLESRLEAPELSAGEAMVLATLGERALTMGGIQGALHIGASTATSLVTRLERSGRVSRRRNPEDARSIVVELTESGREVSAAAALAFDELDDQLRGEEPAEVEAHRAFMARVASLSEAGS